MAESARAEQHTQSTAHKQRVNAALEHRLTHDRPLDPAALAAYLQRSAGNQSLNRLIEESQLQAKAQVGPEGGSVDDDLAAQIQAKRGTDSSLDASTRGSME